MLPLQAHCENEADTPGGKNHPGAVAGAMASGDPGFGLYIHWPFCLSKCPYCDFNSHEASGTDHQRWRRALLRELDYMAARIGGEGEKRPLTSIFFGGGTPSLMEAVSVAALIERAGDHFSLSQDIEITLEANPTSVEAGRFAEFRAAGVNRLSLGVQALDNKALAFLGRNHDRAQALAAVALAQRTFPRTSFDLIYARPGQTLTAWRAELGQALALGGDHFSLYQLTIAPDTPFAARARAGGLAPTNDSSAAALYETTQEVMEKVGMYAYEISSHANKGAESRHNLTYWRYEDYAGIGPGAHGRLTLACGSTAENLVGITSGMTLHKKSFWNRAKTALHRIPAPGAWLAAVEKTGHGTCEETPLDGDQVVTEMLLMGLRLSAGVERALFHEITGQTLPEALDLERLNPLISRGFLELDEAGLRATAQGRQRLDGVLAALLG